MKIKGTRYHENWVDVWVENGTTMVLENITSASEAQTLIDEMKETINELEAFIESQKGE